MGGDTRLLVLAHVPDVFQSTPPAWGATREFALMLECVHVSIHAPRVGGDDKVTPVAEAAAVFQSTPPAWGATKVLRKQNREKNVSIHAPRVGGDLVMLWLIASEEVSIHAPRVGGDKASAPGLIALIQFQSTPPAWGATR